MTTHRLVLFTFAPLSRDVRWANERPTVGVVWPPTLLPTRFRDREMEART